MKQEKNRFNGIRLCLIALFLALGFSTTAMAQQAIKPSDREVENLVRRSYQFVAMFNVIQKFALDPASAGPMSPVQSSRLHRVCITGGSFQVPSSASGLGVHATA